MAYSYKKFFKSLKIIIPIMFSIGLISCDKFDGNQTIPAYVHIEKFKLIPNANFVGSLSNKITDAWVYIDDEFIGAFELPCTFPVLKKGSHAIKVFPGIKMDGIASTRIIYPFYTNILLTKTLTENETLKLDTLTTQYDSNTKFEFIEAFEDGGVLFQKSTINSGGDTNIIKTNQAGNVFEGNYSGLISLRSATTFFEVETIQKYTLPRGASPVFLEMDYKIDNSVKVGLDAYFTGVPAQVVSITLYPNPTQWKKIYINFTPDISNYSTAGNFRIFLGQFKDSGVQTANLLFDNIKLVHFNTSK
jgi:hypothetical protein